MSNNRSQTLYTVFIFTVTHLGDVGALVDDNLFERDILIATKKLACLSNINERSQGIKANPVTMHMYTCIMLSFNSHLATKEPY